MFVFEITNLFRQYCDEPDATWLTPADVAVYLSTGYNEFRWKVSGLSPYTYAIDVTIPATGATTYDLALPANPVRLLGNNLSAGAVRMMQLLQVKSPGSNSSADVAWKGAESLRDLQTSYQSYYLQGTVLHFSYQPNSSLIVTYLPENAVNWANIATGVGAEYVDDLTMFHDVIALLAYKQYAIRDAAINQPLMMQLGTRLAELDSYMTRRNYEGAQYVRRTAATYGDS